MLGTAQASVIQLQKKKKLQEPVQVNHEPITNQNPVSIL